MPTLQYTIVFGVLATEMVVFLLLIFPFPPSWRKAVILNVGKLNTNHSTTYAIYFVFFLVALLFADSIRSMWSHEEKYNLAKTQVVDDRTRTQLRADLFYAERNFYLTGFTLFLSLVLNRFTSIILSLATTEIDLNKAQEKQAVLIKQTENQATEYKKVLAENEELKKQLEASEKLKVDSEVLKKQAKNQEIEYIRLLDEHHELQKKGDVAQAEPKKDK